MRMIVAIALGLSLVACGGQEEDSGMMEEGPGMMADSAAMQDTMESGMMQDTSAMGGAMGADTGMGPDTMDSRRD